MEQAALQRGPLRPAASVHGGVHVPHFKNTAEAETIRIPTPELVILPMRQHIGAPCIPCVKPGDHVDVGQVIGSSESFVSSPIHASISGTVKAIRDTSICNGTVVPSVVIESDGNMTLSPDIKPPKVDTTEQLVEAIHASGLVGLGGAGFPTHVKLSPPKDKKIDTLIINAAECEPFITVDYRECIENSWDVLSGVYAVKELLKIDRVIIAIEDNKPEAFEVLKKIAADKADHDDTVRVMKLKSRYPQGAEKVLIYTTTKRRVPAGKLPADVGCIVMNVGSIAFLSRYLKTGKPLVSRTLTIDGGAVANPQNVRVPLGTRVSDIINFCGGFKAEPSKLLFGGPMMGIAFSDLDHPVLKNNNAILALSEDMAKLPEPYACIRCGRCARYCPMGFVPTLVERDVKLSNIDALKKANVGVCLECGCCAYECPSSRPLVQYMRQAKKLIR